MSRKPKQPPLKLQLMPPPSSEAQVHVKMNGVEVHIVAPTIGEAVQGAEYVLGKIRPVVKDGGYDYG